MPFDSSSQVGQDCWVASCHRLARGLRYLDVGAGDPKSISNTFQLETALGWSGHLVDVSTADQLLAHRPGNVVHRDAFDVDWKQVAATGRFAYMSLDLEPAESTLRALLRILKAGVSFDLATIEHDAYRGNRDVRIAMRAIMESRGYERVASDVLVMNDQDTLSPFEDWWVDPATMNANECRLIACDVQVKAFQTYPRREASS